MGFLRSSLRPMPLYTRDPPKKFQEFFPAGGKTARGRTPKNNALED